MTRTVATSRDLKRSNRSHLLNLLYFNEPTTRLDLSQMSGLSPATVTKIVSELISEDIVIETGVEDSQGGRPRTTLQIDPYYGYFFGVDVGETHIYVELFDIKLNSIGDIKYALTSSEIMPQDIVRMIVDGVRSLQRGSNIPDDKVLGVGIGVPGVVDRAGGVSIFAPNWGWRNVSLLDLVQTQLHLPILLDNGAQAMALAEMWFGAGKGINNLVVLLVGTGIGSGVITDGKLYRGVSNSAGEWGHTCIAMNGRPCRCGSRGCIEAYAGAPAIIEQIRERAPVSSLLNHGSQIEILRALGAAARKGDPLAVGMMDEIGATLGTGIGNLINLFNPQLIVLGGWAGTLLGADLLSRIQAIVGQVALDQPLANTSIRVSALGWDAVSLGAATLALQAFLIGEDITMRKKVRHP
ncbi:MAG: ROK family transcriptional regulator [Chloroflexi bacterium]|nr:ROK family transcriptional regulator [Chloroflexota bacterium]